MTRRAHWRGAIVRENWCTHVGLKGHVLDTDAIEVVYVLLQFANGRTGGARDVHKSVFTIVHFGNVAALRPVAARHGPSAPVADHVFKLRC